MCCGVTPRATHGAGATRELRCRFETPRQDKTYDGAFDLYNHDFVLAPRDRGNGENTISFIERLRALHPNKKRVIVWDGARYHRCEAVRAYLETVNRGLEERNWKVTCLLFAPNAPDQNPVEDMWLRGKNFLRKHFYENKTFRQVKSSFFNFLNQQIINFTKIKWYLKIPRSV